MSSPHGRRVDIEAAVRRENGRWSFDFPCGTGRSHGSVEVLISVPSSISGIVPPLLWDGSSWGDCTESVKVQYCSQQRYSDMTLKCVVDSRKGITAAVAQMRR